MDLLLRLLSASAAASANGFRAREAVNYEAPERVLEVIATKAASLAWGQSKPPIFLSGLSASTALVSLYTAVPHCNSSSMMFAYRNILKGGE